MGISQAEVKLRRLLGAAPYQMNQAKLLQYVMWMREQLALLTGVGGGEGLNQELRNVTEAQAAEYARSIDEIAERIDTTTSPDFWESLQSGKVVQMHFHPHLVVDFDNPNLAPQTLSPIPRRRRLRMDQEDGKAVDGLKLDAAAHETIDKHRHLQQALTEEMAGLSEQLKNNSYLMEKTLKHTVHHVDDTDVAIEHNIAATNHVNQRASIIYKSNWRTGCYTWFMLTLMIFIFVFMVGLIRLTR